MPKTPVYEKYFQKSNAFLFPLLELKRTGKGAFAPTQTYLSLPGVLDAHDICLLVSYKNEQPFNPAWLDYQLNQLMGHPLFQSSLPTTDQSRIVFVFDLGPFRDDVLHFLAGRYGSLSTRAKKLLSAHYGVQTPNWAALEALLYPDKGFPLYAEHFGINEQELRQATGGHLGQRFDAEQETCRLALDPVFVEALADELRRA